MLKMPLKSFKIRIFRLLRRNLGSGLTYVSHIEPSVGEPISDLEAFLNLLTCAFGTGGLAMPKAFYYAGWLIGLLSTFLLGMVVVYAMHVLLQDMITLCKRYNVSRISYSDTIKLATLEGPVCAQLLSKWAALIVNIIMCIYYFGVVCVYVVFIGKTMKDLCDYHFSVLDIRLHITLLTIPLLFIFLMREDKFITAFSIISFLLMVIGSVVSAKYLLTDLPSLKERVAIQHWTKYPLVFGTILFSTEAISIILSVQLSMSTPQNYLGAFGILNRAMFFVILFYAALGFFGYWKFGEEISSSIIMNLPINEFLPQLVRAVFTLAIFFGYARHGYMAIEIIRTNYVDTRLKPYASTTVEYLMRISMVIGSILCAIVYPNFGLLLSLVGSFCLVQMGLIFPAIINICVCYRSGYGPLKIRLWRSLLFIIVGLCGGIMGTVSSIVNMKNQHFSLF